MQDGEEKSQSLEGDSENKGGDAPAASQGSKLTVEPGTPARLRAANTVITRLFPRFDELHTPVPLPGNSESSPHAANAKVCIGLY